jgi:hypothetical protein
MKRTLTKRLIIEREIVKTLVVALSPAELRDVRGREAQTPNTSTLTTQQQATYNTVCL